MGNGLCVIDRSRSLCEYAEDTGKHLIISVRLAMNDRMPPDELILETDCVCAVILHLGNGVGRLGSHETLMSIWSRIL